MDETYYIVRAYEAGLFFGQIAARRGNEVDLVNARKLWYWSGACGPEQLAAEGVKNPQACKFTVIVPEMTVLNVCQIIPCSEAARINLETVAVWRS